MKRYVIEWWYLSDPDTIHRGRAICDDANQRLEDIVHRVVEVDE